MLGTQRSLRGPAALAVAFGLGACGGDDGVVATLNIDVHGPDDSPATSTIGFPVMVDSCVNTLRLTSFQGDDAVDRIEVRWDATPATLPILPFGDDVWIAVEGLNGGGQDCPDPDRTPVVASGATARFSLSKGDAAPPTVAVFTGLPDLFQGAFWFNDEDDASVPLLYEMPDQQRAGHSVTSLEDGSGLVVIGGAKMGPGEGIQGSGITSLVDTIEYYDAYTGQFLTLWDDSCTTADSQCALRLPAGTAFHTATSMADGRVLIVGGLRVEDAGGFQALLPTSDAYVLEITGRAEGNLTEVPYGNSAFPLERAFHTATRMADGRVVIIGGIGRTYDPNPTFQQDIYQVIPSDTLEVSDAGTSLSVPRAMHTATYFDQDAHGIIVVGGRGAAGAIGVSEVIYSTSASFAEPLARDVFAVGNSSSDLAVPRFGHDAVSFSCPTGDAEYLAIVGGYTTAGAGLLEGGAPTATVEIYDPSARFDESPVYAYSPNTVELPGGGRAFGRAAALPLSGDVLYMGGLDGAGVPTDAADRLVNDWSPCDGFALARAVTGGMGAARAHAASTVLGSGFVFVTGGYNGAGSTESSEFYNPNDYTLGAEF